MEGDDLTMKDEWSLSREIVPVATPVPQPSAGSDWSLTVPAGVVWSVQTITAKLVTSSAVANRIPNLTITVNGVVAYNGMCTATVPGSSNWLASWARGVGTDSEGGTYRNAIMTFPIIALPPQSIISMSTYNIQTGDQWSNIAIYSLESRMRRVDAESAELGRFNNAIDSKLLHGW